tara:strand:+ start:1527 stop:1955 length:429 start_codon:yes stop_codon:yes gene_type:complete
MGGSRGSAPTHYRHKPTAPIIYQKIQGQAGWDAADDFLKRLRGERDKIAGEQAKVLDSNYQTALTNEAAKRQAASTTQDNPIWAKEQAARHKISQADSAWDQANQLAISAKNLTDKKRQKGQLGSLQGQEGASYTPPKPSGT